MTGRPYTQSNVAGRALLALRAGAMTTDQLVERFGSNVNTALARLAREGLIVRTADVDRHALWRLTDAGRIACPRRRDPVKPPNLPYPDKPRKTKGAHAA